MCCDLQNILIIDEVVTQKFARPAEGFWLVYWLTIPQTGFSVGLKSPVEDNRLFGKIKEK